MTRSEREKSEVESLDETRNNITETPARHKDANRPASASPMSFPYQKKPRQNLSLDLTQPIPIKPAKRAGLKHTNSICFPVTATKTATLNHNQHPVAPMTSRLSLANHKSSSHPAINHTDSEDVPAPTVDHTFSNQQHQHQQQQQRQNHQYQHQQQSVKMVTTMELPNRISSSSESEEDGEGWLLLNERSKPWPEPDHCEVKLSSLQPSFLPPACFQAFLSYTPFLSSCFCFPFLPS